MSSLLIAAIKHRIAEGSCVRIEVSKDKLSEIRRSLTTEEFGRLSIKLRSPAKHTRSSKCR